MHQSVKMISVLTIFMIILSACNMPGAEATPAANNPDLIFTQAAQTVAAQLTQSALLNPATPIPPTAEQATAAPTMIAPTLPVNTPAVPTAAISTATSLPPVTAGSPTPSCDSAQFVTDVTVPDGTNYNGGDSFIKTWRLKNTGTCTWNSSYTLVFDTGEIMGGPASQSLTNGNIAPGQEVEVSVALKAPNVPGTYRGYWRIRNSAGDYLPVANGFQNKSFYVEIKVGGGGSGGTNTGGKFAVTSVTFNVTHTGSCASGKYVITATVTANGAGQVTYSWIRSDGATDTVSHPPLEFTAAGSQTVSTEWNTSASGLWVGLYIDKPNHQEFKQANLNCP